MYRRRTHLLGFLAILICFSPTNGAMDRRSAKCRGMMANFQPHHRSCAAFFSAGLPAQAAGLLWAVSLGAAASLFHIAEGGVPGRYDGRSIENILGRDPKGVTMADLRRLSKYDFMQLFYAAGSEGEQAEVPAQFLDPRESYEGEWRAEILPIGLVHPVTRLITDHLFGDGRWCGKAFEWGKEEDKTAKKDAAANNGSCRIRGTGCNIFAKGDGEGLAVARMRPFAAMASARSRHDGRPALVLDYTESPWPLSTMRDELRPLPGADPAVLIGLGSMGVFGGHLNSAAFALSSRFPLSPQKDPEEVLKGKKE